MEFPYIVKYVHISIVMQYFWIHVCKDIHDFIDYSSQTHIDRIYFLLHNHTGLLATNHYLIRLVNSHYYKKLKKPAHEILNEIIVVFLSNRLSKFPCQPNLLTPGSLFLLRTLTLASLVFDTLSVA